MSHKKVMISIPPELNEKWNELSKKHRISKSGMIEDYLYRVLPQLDLASISDVDEYVELLRIRKIDKNASDEAKRIDDEDSLFMIPFD